MNDKIDRRRRSARSLLIASAVLLILGVVIMDPAAGVLLLSLSGLLSLSSAFLGASKIRYISIFVLFMAVMVAYLRFPGESSLYRNYLDKAEQEAIENKK